MSLDVRLKPDSLDKDSHFIDICIQTDPAKEKNIKNIYKIKEVLALSFVTYLSTSFVFYLIGNETPLLNAFVPTTGYFISTLEKEKVLNLAKRVKNTMISCFSFFLKNTHKENIAIPSDLPE